MTGSVISHAPASESIFARFVGYFQRQWLRCLVLVTIGVGVRVPALQGQLIWDDTYLIRENPFIRSPILILEAFRHYLFPDSYSGHYRPVQTVSYIFDYLVWNDNPYGYHLSNIAWHVASGILLYFLLLKLLPALVRKNSDAKLESKISVVAFFVALLWLVHPVHSAAIDYISGRADSLTFFFACAAWLAYLRGRSTTNALGRRGLYFLAVFSTLLAFCARESAGLWMLVFLLHLFAFEPATPLRHKLLVLTACFVIAASYLGLRHLPESRPDHITPTGWGAPIRATLMLRALGDYGRLMLWPTKLHIERNVFEPAIYRSVPSWRNSVSVEYLSIGGLAVLAVFVAGAWRKGIGRRVRIFGAAWFILTYLPLSNLFELNATVAEHWLYLPSVGFLIFVAGCAIEASLAFRHIAAALATVAVIALGARSIVRSSDWIDPETFFRRTFAEGGSSSRIGVNLAVIYASRGEHAKAEAILRRVLQVMPGYPLARTNLAIALARQGKAKEAEALFASTSHTSPEDRTVYPKTWSAVLNLAHIRHNEKDDVAALALLDRAREDYPGTWELVRFESEISREIQGPDTALALVENFARSRWWHAGASIALGRLYSEKGETALAAAAFRHASRLDVHDVEALNLSALMSSRQGRFEEAREIQERAVDRQPYEARQYLLLSDILNKMGRSKEAQEALARVADLKTLAHAGTVAN